MPLGRKVDGGSNYKCYNFEDRERILERITMNITFEPHGRVQNENRKIFMISLGYVMYVCHVYIYNFRAFRDVTCGRMGAVLSVFHE